MNNFLNPNEISIICEIASAHGGDVSTLKKLLNEAESAGADWTKVQIYEFKSLVADENDIFNDLSIIELSPDEWTDVINFAGKLKTKLIAEVFDLNSLRRIANNKAIKAFKIPTADLGDIDFVDEVCKLGKPIFVGVGGATLDEIDSIYKQITSYKGVDLVLLHGFQSFPTKLEDSLLAKIKLFQSRFECEIGFADHIDAEEKELVKALPAMAIASGASVIEKHITLDRSLKGFDYYSALNPDEFSDFVSFIKNINVAIGPKNSLDLSHAEINYRNKMKKFAVLSNNVKKGSLVKSAKIQYLRTSISGITRKDLKALENKVFAANFKKNTVLSKELIC